MLNNKVKYRQSSYNSSDSGIMFLLALVVPQFLMILIMLICTSATGMPFASAGDGSPSFASTYPTLYTVLAGVVPQVSMLLSFLFISERKKISYGKANQISFKNFNWLVMLIVLAIGVVCLFGFTPFVNWFDGLMAGMGYKSSVAGIDVSSVGQFIGAIFYVAMLPAICEELVFRGVITNGLKQNGVKIAVVLSAVLFALMHQNLQQFVYQLFLGGVMAYIVLKTGNILYTMLLHFFNNFVVLLDTHLNGSSAPAIDYTNAWNSIWPLLLIIATVAVVVGLLFLLNFVIKKQNQNSKQNTDNMQCAAGKQSTTIKQNNDGNKSLNNAEQTDAKQNQTSALKNPYVVIALVAGVLLWVFSVVSGFLA